MSTPMQSPDFEMIKQRQQMTWAAGDYARIGNQLVITAELLCEALELRAGQRVLDVAAGNGNAALAAARRFCDVTATDYVPELLEDGRRRATAEGLPLTFQEADAENLPFPDASFDVVLSTFGAIFAPDHERVARELMRVCRPGGKIGMANWAPEGFVGDFFRTAGKHAPPPPGVRSPLLWASEAHLRQLFGAAVAALHMHRRTFVFRHHTPQGWIDYYRANFGPTLKAFEALDELGKHQLDTDLLTAIERHNSSGDGTMFVPGEYMEVIAVKQEA